MKKTLSNLIVMISAFVALLSTVVIAAGGEWVQEGSFWKYKKNGSFISSEWENIDGIDYYFKDDYTMATGICGIANKYYAFQDNGKPYDLNSTITVCGKSYSIGEKGLIKKADFDELDIKLYEESVAQKKENEAMQKAVYESNVAKLEGLVKETTTINNITPIGVIEQVKKEEVVVTEEKKGYTIPQADKDKFSKVIETSGNGNNVARNLATELSSQLSVIRLQIQGGTLTELKKNVSGVDATDGQALFDAVINEYNSYINNLVDYATIKYTLNETGISKCYQALSQVIYDNVKKFEKFMNED